MPWIAPVIGGVAALGGALIGKGSADADRGQAMQLAQQSVQDLMNIGIPPMEAQKIVLQQYQSAGNLTPELEQAISMGDSAMGDVSTDPTYKQAGLDALNSLRDIGQSGGMTLSDQANLEKTMGDVRSQEKGSRDAITSGMASRGQLGSGLELASQLSNEQNAATNEHAAGIQAAANAQARALDAIRSGGQLGAQLQGQDFSQKAQQAQAKDAISRFNAENAQNVQQRNAAASNYGQQYNLANNQNLMNQNTNNANQQEVYNKGLYQQDFQNRFNVSQAAANARAGQASNLQQNANATQQMWGNIGSGLAKAGTAAGDYWYKASQKKNDEEE